MLSVNGRSHMICHVLTLRIFGVSKKLRFWQNRENVFNQLNSTNWVKLHKGHVQGSWGEVTCKGHVQRLSAGDMQFARSDLHLQMGGGFNSTNSFRVKRRCQLLVRLKANKCYQGLLCYLSSYINFLNIRLCIRLQGPGRFQTFSLWSRTHTGSQPLAVLVLVLIFGQLSLSKICRDPTALRWVVCFIAIQPLSDKSLDFGCSIRQWFSVVCLFPIACLIGLNRSIVGSIGWCFWYRSRNYSFERFKTKLFPWTIRIHIRPLPGLLVHIARLSR